MDINELNLAGCFEITPKIFKDDRGHFVKVYHEKIFSEKGIQFEMKEEFYSTSQKNVFRGLHFQLPPVAHNKLVYCAQGSVIDFLFDLRKNSLTYQKSISVELNEKNRKSLFIPIGIAHGFFSLTDNSLMVYKTDSVYAPEQDSGILFSSCNLKGLSNSMILSKRDMEFPEVQSFKSPF